MGKRLPLHQQATHPVLTRFLYTDRLALEQVRLRTRRSVAAIVRDATVDYLRRFEQQERQQTSAAITRTAQRG